MKCLNSNHNYFEFLINLFISKDYKKFLIEIHDLSTYIYLTEMEISFNKLINIIIFCNILATSVVTFGLM